MYLRSHFIHYSCVSSLRATWDALQCIFNFVLYSIDLNNNNTTNRPYHICPHSTRLQHLALKRNEYSRQGVSTARANKNSFILRTQVFLQLVTTFFERDNIFCNLCDFFVKPKISLLGALATWLLLLSRASFAHKSLYFVSPNDVSCVNVSASRRLLSFAVSTNSSSNTRRSNSEALVCETTTTVVKKNKVSSKIPAGYHTATYHLFLVDVYDARRQ